MVTINLDMILKVLLGISLAIFLILLFIILIKIISIVSKINSLLEKNKEQLENSISQIPNLVKNSERILENTNENLEKINKKIKNIKEDLIYVDSKNREYFEREKQQKYVVVQTFNIEVKDIKNISKVIDLAKKYDMKIDSPNFYIKNSEYDIKEEVSKVLKYKEK